MCIDIDDMAGWVATSHHKGISTYVIPEELEGSDPIEVVIGMIGRAKRNQDALELKIIYVEDNRAGF